MFKAPYTTEDALKALEGGRSVMSVWFKLNGKMVESASSPAARLLDVVRSEFGLTGSKCGCKEGECGACSVLLDGLLVNSCMVAIGTLPGHEVTTIEGYRETARFRAIDKAFGQTGAVQCGFCTPGMVLAAESLLNRNPRPTEAEIRDGISGNLCRCTGYSAIVEGIKLAAKEGRGPMVSFKPATLKEALEIRAREKVVPYAGGTDLMIEAEPEASYLFLADVPELRTIEIVDGNLEIGASVTYTQALDSALVPEILKEAVRYIAAPAIRNAGTFGGNVANGSPKADSALVFSVTDSILLLESSDGARRVPIQEFYLGRGKTCLKDDELLTKIVMPIANAREYYYHKVGARGALAIARVSFAGLLRVEGGIICHAATAYGAVAGTILRRADIDGMLIGRTVEEARRIRGDYLSAMDEAIQPIRGRISAEYRKKVLMNLIADFLNKYGITP